jgi:hypothetical protein
MPNRWGRLAAILLSVCASAPASAALAMCSSEGAAVFVPKGYSIASIEYQQVADAPPVRATLWSDRLGPRTVDGTMEAMPKGEWTPVQFQDPAEFQEHDKDWRMGVQALYSDPSVGDYSKEFECVNRELHAHGDDPWGWYVLDYLPHESAPGQVGFRVRVRLQRGPLRQPKHHHR